MEIIFNANKTAFDSFSLAPAYYIKSYYTQTLSIARARSQPRYIVNRKLEM